MIQEVEASGISNVVSVVLSIMIWVHLGFKKLSNMRFKVDDILYDKRDDSEAVIRNIIPNQHRTDYTNEKYNTYLLYSIKKGYFSLSYSKLVYMFGNLVERRNETIDDILK